MMLRVPTRFALFVCLASTPGLARPLQGLVGENAGTDALPPTFISTPALTPNANPAVPLAARIAFGTDEPTRAFLHIKDGERSWRVLAEPSFLQSHEVPVLGVRPGREHHIAVVAEDAAGNETTADVELVWTTPRLPAFFPPVQPQLSLPAQMEPGVTLFDASQSRVVDSFLVIVDEQGEVIWYYRTPRFLGDSQRISNGNLLYLWGKAGATEIDMFGDVVEEWYAVNLGTDEMPPGATPVAADSFHHDILELPPGGPADFAVLTSELREYPDYPTSEVDPTQTEPVGRVVGDVIVEFDRDGTVVAQWRTLDVLDPYRLCYGSLNGSWGAIYGLTGTRDWAHGNAIVYLPERDAYLYSARHQECVVEFARGTLAIDWILGPHERWGPPWDARLLTPVGSAFEWQYQQHAPMLTAAGTVLIYDNGIGRAVPPDAELPEPARWSRAVEFDVDTNAMSVEQVWSYGDASGQFYSASLCEADELPTTGNILVADGDRVFGPGPGPAWARIVEVTHSAPAVPVFEVYVRDDAPMPENWNVYRCERLAGIYP